MPVKLERKLKKRARQLGFVKRVKGKIVGLSERGRRYVYGTMRRMGWKPSHQRK